MNIKDFSYTLPPELIAAYPAQKRDQSRLMVTTRGADQQQLTYFHNILDFIGPEDHLVFNDVRVINARLFGKKMSGGAVEIFLNRLIDPEQNRWVIIGKKIQKLKTGSEIMFDHDLKGTLIRSDQGFEITFNLNCEAFDIWLQEHGHLPLPPYIIKSRESKSDEMIDYDRYQTVYARNNGAVAAPTAGLHFTEDILAQLHDKGISSSFVTLYVGLGTFMPIKSETVEGHEMHTERYEISSKAASEINDAKRSGKRIICVGTTSLRALESATEESGILIPGEEDTDIYIYPGYQFKITDGLITNFHLPDSTLLLLVAALHGQDNISTCYQRAITEGFRFYSYGDAMFIKPVVTDLSRKV